MRPYREVLWEWFLLHAEPAGSWFKKELTDKVMPHLRECGATGDLPRFVRDGSGEIRLTVTEWQCTCGEFHAAGVFWLKNRMYVSGPLIVVDVDLTEAELAYKLIAYELAISDSGTDLIERIRRAYG